MNYNSALEPTRAEEYVMWRRLSRSINNSNITIAPGWYDLVVPHSMRKMYKKVGNAVIVYRRMDELLFCLPEERIPPYERVIKLLIDQMIDIRRELQQHLVNDITRGVRRSVYNTQLTDELWQAMLNVLQHHPFIARLTPRYDEIRDTLLTVW
jgi:hypothetical protein